MIRQRTPLDKRTGTPLLVVPSGSVPQVMRGHKVSAEAMKARRFSDRNHVYHPEYHPLLHADLGGLAVQGSRVQWMLRTKHDMYHAKYSGPPLPITPSQKFRTVTFHQAMHIPERAIDLPTFGEPRIVKQNDRQLQRLRRSGEVRPDTPARSKAYMQAYVLEYATDLPLKQVDDFLFAGQFKPRSHAEYKEQAELAYPLLEHAIGAATTSLARVYRAEYHEGRMGITAPPTVEAFVMRELVGANAYTMSPLVKTMHAQLAAERAGELLPAYAV
jgi:hypothetical protein